MEAVVSTHLKETDGSSILLGPLLGSGRDTDVNVEVYGAGSLIEIIVRSTAGDKRQGYRFSLDAFVNTAVDMFQSK